jgi:hypothetical protein
VIDTVHTLVSELRRMRLDVATSDLVAAAGALEHVDLGSEAALREALACCIAKSPDHRDAFNLLFELYFSAGTTTAARTVKDLDDDALREALVGAIARGRRHLLREIAAEAVDRFAQMEPGRAVAGTYYVFRTLRGLGLAERTRVTCTDTNPADSQLDTISRAISERRRNEAQTNFERIVESEVRRRLVEDRGPAAVASVLHQPLPEDVPFLSASEAVIERMTDVVAPLARQLGQILTERQHSIPSRRLDVRRTIRRSLPTGGSPVELHFLAPQALKPRLVVLADISGSVAGFASFALQLTYAIRTHFSTLRSFVFVDGVDEVTDLVGRVTSISTTVRRINAEGRGVWLDGHSDYGHAFASFTERHLSAVDRRTTVLILGDARTNYRDPNAAALKRIRKAAAAIYWLNPEHPGTWNDGDAVMSEYSDYCDETVECRTIRQLTTFITSLR